MTDLDTPVDEAGRDLDAAFVDAAVPPGPRARGGGFGRPRFYSYDNLSTPAADAACSCGHAAIATLLDFHDCAPLPPQRRTAREGQGMADDGRLHFPNETLVRMIFEAWPPTNWLGIRFVPRETIAGALRHAGLRVGEAWPPLLGSEDERFGIARRSLCDWIARTGLPVLVLVDTVPLLGQGGLHWGLVHAFDDHGVKMASWHRTFDFDWATFAEAWHCRGWIFPNNFYAQYVAR
jgi:hypothetical protein